MALKGPMEDLSERFWDDLIVFGGLAPKVRQHYTLLSLKVDQDPGSQGEWLPCSGGMVPQGELLPPSDAVVSVRVAPLPAMVWSATRKP